MSQNSDTKIQSDRESDGVQRVNKAQTEEETVKKKKDVKDLKSSCVLTF